MGPAPPRAGFERVSVLLLTHPGGPDVDQVLEALAQQRPRPERVVVMGLSRDSPVAAAVAAALDKLPQDPGQWVWILHDDSRPRPGALEALVDVARRSGRVGVVGPKLVRAEDPRAVLSVGHRMTRRGRLIAEEGSGLVDQGQFDDRTDVIGVPLPGALVRADVLIEIGGVEPVFDEGTEGLDLCWRAHLRGHRVAVAPQAVVAQGSAGLGVTSTGRHRRRVRQVALARGSLWSTPWRAVRICVGALLTALALLLVSRPGAALAELADIGAVLSPRRGLGARWRFRGQRQIRDRDLRGLFESPRSGWRATGDIMRDPWAPRPRAEGEKRVQAGVETGPVAEGVDSEVLPVRARWRSWWLGTAVLVSGLISLARWRDVLAGLSPGGYGVRGGELVEVSAGAAGLWGAWALPWSGPGLGSQGQGPPWLLPLAGWTWLVERLPGGPEPASSAAVATAWLLLLAPPAAAVTAYVAAGVSGGGRGLRAVVALVWATLAPLWAAVDQGRVGPVVVHVLAPVVVAGALLALDRPRRPSSTTPAVLGAALAGAIAVWFVPGVLVWLALVAVVVLVGAPGRSRWRAALLIGVPTLLCGPWLLRLIEQPLLLGGGAGATASGEPVPAWQVLLLHPGGLATPVLWWTVPLWVLALASTLVPGLRGLRATSALCCALCGLGLALLAPWAQWGSVPAGYPDAAVAVPVTTWPGSYLSLAGAGVLLAATQGATSLQHRRATLRAGNSSARVLGAVAAVLVLVTVVASLGTAGWRALGTPDATLRAAAPAAPGVVTEQLGGPAAPRWLALVPVAGPTGYVVRYTLAGAEPTAWLRDRVRETDLPAEVDDEDERSAVRELVDGDLRQTTATSGEPAGLPQALTDLAIGYVTVAANAEHPLVQRIDAVPGLTRISTPTGARELLWRALPDAQPAGTGPISAGPARVTLRTAQDDEVVIPSGPHGTVRKHEIGVPLPRPGPDPSTLLVSEPSRWSDVAVARADGTVLAPRGSLPVRYDIPPGTQAISLTLPLPYRAWWIGTAAFAVGVLLVLLLRALGRRSRSR